MLLEEGRPVYCVVRIGRLFHLARKNNNPNRSQASSLWDRLLNAGFTKLNRYIAWDKLPPFFGIFNLLALRNLLRERNLHDTSDLMSRPSPGKCPPQDLVTRRSDGKYNDLGYPDMGAAGERFGRNVPIKYVSGTGTAIAGAKPSRSESSPAGKGDFHSGAHSKPSRRLMDPVSNARLV